MQEQVNKPIFVVGSPRSGTSVLTWCLGQHPNIFPVPESNWMGDFAVNAAIGYQIGAARGDRSILSAMDIREDELFAMCGQRKLFPKALFIHLIRDVRSVVRSMLNFHLVAGHNLVNNEQEAYDYWFRTVSSCLLAERAYGPRVVLRLRYSDLLNATEIAIRSVLEFIGERYTTACLNPLEKRINSSNVPIDFEIDNSRTDPALLERTARLCTEIEKTPQPIEVSPAAFDEIEAVFNERVRYVASLNSEYQRALQIIAALQNETAQRTAGCIDRQSDL